MKTTILLIFSFIFITGSLFGQKDKHNYIDSDIRNQFFPITSLDSPRLKKPYLNSFKKLDSPTLRDFERFGLYPDNSSFKDKRVRLYSDFVVVEEFPGASRYFAKRPNLLFFPYEKSFIIKPDTTVKQYLRPYKKTLGVWFWCSRTMKADINLNFTWWGAWAWSGNCTNYEWGEGNLPFYQDYTSASKFEKTVYKTQGGTMCASSAQFTSYDVWSDTYDVTEIDAECY